MCNTKCAINKGFTLVELLVVIAIIALLMSILMPAMGRAKRQALAVACQSNLREWGLVFQMYASENDGSLPQSIAGGNLSTQDAYWMAALLPYYEDKKLRLCPMAATSRNPDNCDRCLGTTFSAWGPFPPGNSSTWWDTGAMGSYGINEWCANPPPGADSYWGFPSKYAWRTTDATGAGNVPVFLDSLYIDGYPQHTDEPPIYPEVAHDAGDWGLNAIQLYCIDRHNGGINGVFMDWSVRKIGLKELWKLKWHRRFDTSFPPPDWASEAPWMMKLRDY